MVPFRKTGLALAVVAALLAGGCNGDSGGGGVVDPGPKTVEVEAGTWRVSAAVGGTGGLCTTVATSFADSYPGPEDLVLCGPVDPNVLLGQLGDVPVDCEVTINGNQVNVGCSGQALFLGCTVNFAGAGTGNIATNRKSFSISVPVGITTTGGEGCSTTPCTANVTVSAVWINAEGCGPVETASLSQDVFTAMVFGLLFRE